MIWVAVIVTILLFVLLAIPMGTYLERSFQGSQTLDKVFGPIERIIFKCGNIKQNNQTWVQYHTHQAKARYSMTFRSCCLHA
ncbi:potassium-transporting ATPase subunit KdpA [Bacillus toyonensis]|uniref:potassium-transporting ATPase subunit KdpA n=1 Tax=Bacillus toyonensis TaxID=155322 RepID=UPI0026C72702